MKRFFLINLILLGLFLGGFTPVFALTPVGLDMSDISKEQVSLDKKPKFVKGSLLITDDQMLDELIELQKKKDLEDLENLWKATVANNKVIGFALKKLATPESQRRIHSSLMAKTLSAVVSGSSFVPTVMGADPTVRTGAFAAGRLAQALINKNNMPQEIPLTDTELIELAGLVEDLQDKIIEAYYNYKGALGQVKETREKLILYNKNYSKALDTGDILDISISSALYDNLNMQEYYYMQSAKKYHIELQRLAGKNAVANLNLYQYNFNSALFKGKNTENKNKALPKKILKVQPVVPVKTEIKTNTTFKTSPAVFEVKKNQKVEKLQPQNITQTKTAPKNPTEGKAKVLQKPQVKLQPVVQTKGKTQPLTKAQTSPKTQTPSAVKAAPVQKPLKVHDLKIKQQIKQVQTKDSVKPQSKVQLPVKQQPQKKGESK